MHTMLPLINSDNNFNDQIIENLWRQQLGATGDQLVINLCAKWSARVAENPVVLARDGLLCNPGYSPKLDMILLAMLH